MWYGRDHSFGTFADPGDEYAAAAKMYRSTFFIIDKDDPLLKDHTDFAGWTYPQDSVFMNLTSSEFREEFTYNTTGGAITPPMRMRDTLVHELTHFITKDRKEGQIDQFAKLHADSDLDGLTKAFADSSSRTFQDDSEKIQYGLSIIISLKDVDRKVIGEHIQSIKN